MYSLGHIHSLLAKFVVSNLLDQKLPVLVLHNVFYWQFLALSARSKFDRNFQNAYDAFDFEAYANKINDLFALLFQWFCSCPVFAEILMMIKKFALLIRAY